MNYKNSILGLLVFALSIVFATASCSADDTAQLKQKIDQLQAQVSQLKQQLADKSANNVPAIDAPSYDVDPFREMQWMQRQMSRMMQDAAMPALNIFQTKVDINKTDSQYVITIDLPGMQKDNINIEVKDRVLMVSGERTSEFQETKGNQYFRKERSFGHFMQNIPLPDDAKEDQMDAQYHNGVLKVMIPREKREGKKVESKKILIK